jgi:pimeloyl-ACP methyl ester carboxylesterase
MTQQSPKSNAGIGPFDTETSRTIDPARRHGASPSDRIDPPAATVASISTEHGHAGAHDQAVATGIEAQADAPEWFRRVTGQKPERSFLAVNDIPIEVLTWGERGRPGLLFLHGNLAHADWWSFIAPYFMDRYRIAALSYSGMGRSGHGTQYTLPIYASEARAVAESAGLFDSADKPSIIAHSAGGGVAVVLCAEQGDRFARAVIIDSIVIPNDRNIAATLGPGTGTAGKPSPIYATVEDGLARYRLAPPQPAGCSFVLDWIARHSIRQTEHGWTWRFDPNLRGAITGRAAAPSLPLARCPLIFVSGALSSVATPDRLDIMRRNAPPGTRFFSIPEAHHHVMVDQPLALIATLNVLLEASRMTATAYPTAPIV